MVYGNGICLGIDQKLDPKQLGYGPFEENIWEISKVEQTPNDLFEILDNLKKDKVLVKSGVFHQSLIDSYIEVKRDEAIQTLLYPTPADFWFYSDI